MLQFLAIGNWPANAAGHTLIYVSQFEFEIVLSYILMISFDVPHKPYLPHNWPANAAGH